MLMTLKRSRDFLSICHEVFIDEEFFSDEKELIKDEEIFCRRAN